MNLTSEKTHKDEHALQGYKKTQDLAYRCALEIASELQEGWTEKKTAQLMDQWLKDHGVKTYFHKSFAWFGERASFHQFKSQFDFLPSERVFKEGEVVILDTAPIYEGYTADIGFTFSKTPNIKLAEARSFLLELRALILKRVVECKDLGEVWKEVDQKILEKNFVNCHAKYPFSVLGHRVHQVGLSQLPGLIIPFSLHAAWSLLKRGLLPELLTEDHSGHKDGYWAIEPHFGNTEFGIKFEEILVIKGNKAFWLSDEVPHLKMPKELY